MKMLLVILALAAILEFLLILIFGSNIDIKGNESRSLKALFFGFLENTALIAMFGWLLKLI